VAESGTSTKSYTALAFAKALAQAISRSRALLMRRLQAARAGTSTAPGASRHVVTVPPGATRCRHQPRDNHRDLAVTRRILNPCARLWRCIRSDVLETPPPIQMQRHPNKRQPYPLSIEEERLPFSELEGHLARMAQKSRTRNRSGDHRRSQVIDLIGGKGGNQILEVSSCPENRFSIRDSSRAPIRAP
jgi:hypothetical protein